MKNHGLFSSLFLQDLKRTATLDDSGQGRMSTLLQARQRLNQGGDLWKDYIKQVLSYLEFVPAAQPTPRGVYPLFDDWDFQNTIALICAAPPGGLDDTRVGRFLPARLLLELKQRKLNWGILTDGDTWRLYSLKSSRPYEDYVELPLTEALGVNDESEYALFERFFHLDAFTPVDEKDSDASTRERERKAGVYTCRLDQDRAQSEAVLEERVKKPLLAQVDEALQYLCNGFIQDTDKTGEDYSEEERREIFENAVKLLYRCLFLFYAEARRLLPSDPEIDVDQPMSIHTVCEQARFFRWGERNDNHSYDLWQYLKGLTLAVKEGCPGYCIMGYNGGLFDDKEERFLGQHRLRNDFLARALYLLSRVDPGDAHPEAETEIPYQDLEVRHLGELYENILEFNVMLCDADRLRRRGPKGVQILLASDHAQRPGDTLIRKGEVYFGESALERKQSGSYYTPESLVRFLNEKAIVEPLRERFRATHGERFDGFVRQAREAVNPGDAKGASRAAHALVKRFIEEDLKHFRVCDPAMGSGHFLVDAANQMAGLVVELLAEIPVPPGAELEEDASPNPWRRLVTRHCLYGADLNPLAVNLGKLSLWLNCFAGEHKLTFLDHHLRCGNSLIGLRDLDQLHRVPRRKKDGKKKKGEADELFPLDSLSAQLREAAARVARIGGLDEDDTDQQKQEFETAREETDPLLKPLANLFTAYLMDPGISPTQYQRLFHQISGGKTIDPLSQEELDTLQQRVDTLARRHHYFHWPLEFPDAMTGESPGFSATVGNPPWDIVKPNSQEFFSDYDPAFRSYKKQEALRKSETLMAQNPVVRQKWEEYSQAFVEQSAYVREEAAYKALGKGDINTYKLFLEQFFRLLQPQGQMGIVTPSGLYTDQGCLPLRKLFFEKSQIRFLYCFENRWPAVFPAVDGRFKFIVFSTRKGGKTESFKCAFMQHDPERLPAIDGQALRMTMEQVRKFSPADLGLMEFNDQREIDISFQIYHEKPLLGKSSDDDWGIRFNAELHMTNASHLFLTEDNGNPLYEGKTIWQFDNKFEEHQRWVDPKLTREYLGTSKSWETTKYRLGYRDIAASTNERTLIASIIPPGFHGNKLPTIVPKNATDNEGLDDADLLYMNGFFCGFVLDFIIRQKITTTINFFYLFSLPVPKNDKTNFSQAITCRCARLIAIDEEYSGLWGKNFQSHWCSSKFWYPPEDDLNYGPAEEREIRERIKAQAAELTAEWTPACGVYDRLPDRRDTGDRAQLRAEIDAMVAHLYGLSRDDFAYILDTFPVLKKKELKAFGEFKSKRKCLEEYDRLGARASRPPPSAKEDA